MAALTWYMTNNLAGTAHQEMSETDPGTEANASPQTGWVVGTGATNHASLDAQSNVASASFTATTQPDGTPVTTAGAGDCLRTTDTYSGTFASANWTMSFCFRGVTQAGTQDGRVRFRLLRGTLPDGSNATEITAAQQQASLVTNLLTTPTQTSSLAFNPGAITVNNEYIFVQVAWERTGAGGMTTTDVAFRIGNTSGAGTRVQSSNFTPTPPTTTPPDLANVVNRPRLRPVTALALLAAAGSFWVPPPPPEPEVEPFVFATVSNARVGSRSLFYQANIAPPVFASLPVPPITIDKWQQPLSKAVPYPKVPGGRQHWVYAYPEIEPPPPFLSADVVTGRATTKSLFYQSRTQVYPPAAEAVTVTLDWQQPLSIAVKRPPTETGLYTPFVPPLAPQVSADEWLTPFTRAVARPAVDNALHTPFIPREAVLDNTVTPDAWMRQLDRAVPIPRAAQSQVTYAYTVVAEDNTVTPDKWLIKWDAPPRYLLRLQLGSPFVPRAAVLENTVEPSYWMQPFYKAAPVPPVHVTQPFFGYPYEGVDNSRDEWDWTIQWQGPPRYWPLGKPYQPFVPEEATRENTVTPDYWMQKWQSPPRLLLRLQPGSPFIPTAEVVDNTRTEIDWLVAWQGPPRLLLRLQPGSPFVAKAAVLENTVEPSYWMRPLDQAVPYPPVRHTQPFFGYPYEGVDNSRDEWDWHIQWKGPPRLWPLGKPYSPFVPAEATRQNTVTPDKWMRGLDRATRKRPVNVTQPVYPYQAPPEAGTVTPTTYWFPPLSRSVKLRPPYIGRSYYAGPVLAPQVILPQVYQYVPGAPTTVTFRKYTQYQSWVKVPGIVPPSPVTSFVQSPDTSVTFRRTIQYQASPFIPSGALPGQQQFVSISLTVEFGRVLRYVCKSPEESGFVVQLEQSDPWSTQSEQADAWAEEQQEPGAGCCDTGEIAQAEDPTETEGDFQDDSFQDDSFE